jgi:hypothetical protein
MIGSSVAEERSSGSSSPAAASAAMTSPLPGNLVNEEASRFCPVCSKRLESRRCKLICDVCGYYMSCADYY